MGASTGGAERADGLLGGRGAKGGRRSGRHLHLDGRKGQAAESCPCLPASAPTLSTHPRFTMPPASGSVGLALALARGCAPLGRHVRNLKARRGRVRPRGILARGKQLQPHALLDETQQAVAQLVRVHRRAQRHIKDPLSVLHAPRASRGGLLASRSRCTQSAPATHMRKPGPRLQCRHGPGPRHSTGTHGTYGTHRLRSLAGATLAPQPREQPLDLGKQCRAERPERLVEAGAARASSWPRKSSW